MTVDGAWCAFGLGSNLGEREKLVGEAIEALRSLPGLDFLGHASFYETEPLDCPPGSPSFLNTAAHGHYTGDVFDLLHETQRIETQLGRRRTGLRNEARCIDIDLLVIDDVVMQSDALTLPHPRLSERLFVLEPLHELRPEFILPDGQPISDAIRELKESTTR